MFGLQTMIPHHSSGFAHAIRAFRRKTILCNSLSYLESVEQQLDRVLNVMG